MKENKMPFSELVTKVKKVCKDFLNKHGGLSNGYETYITGEVINEHGFLAMGWMTPSRHGMTFEMANTLGCELYHEIHKLLLQSEFSSIQFKVDTENDGDFHTHITFLKNGGEIFL